jgi:hypothetical protein
VLSFCVRKEANGNVLLFLFVVLLEQKRQWQFNTTKEEGDDNKLPSPFSLQQHYRKRRLHIAIVFFFSTTPPQKKTMAHYCRLLLVKHKIDKTHKKKKTKRREGSYFQAPVLPSHFWLPLLPFYFKRFLLTFFSSQAKEKQRKP